MSDRRTKPRQNAVALGRKQLVLELARAGRTPAEIADRVDEPFASVMTKLYGLIGEGALKRSDLVFAYDQDVRDAIELAIEEQLAARERAADEAAGAGRAATGGGSGGRGAAAGPRGRGTPGGAREERKRTRARGARARAGGRSARGVAGRISRACGSGGAAGGGS